MKERCQVVVPILPAPHDTQEQINLHPTNRSSAASCIATSCNAQAGTFEGENNCNLSADAEHTQLGDCLTRMGCCTQGSLCAVRPHAPARLRGAAGLPSVCSMLRSSYRGQLEC
jgi:hypothetical protein